MKTALFVVIYTAVLFEILSVALVKREWWPGGYPSYDPEKVTATFWKDVNPAFGVWRDPESEFRHVTACFDLVYRTNRHGMRDAERELAAEVPRVLVLGDSVVEGYGVAREARLSNLLERETGVPHLNFGTSGSFGPLQYRLLYETFASGFSHDSIILGIYPNNDLSDLLADPARKATSERYRPYYVKENGEYRVVYRVETLEEAARAAEEGRFRRTFANVLREFVASAHVLRFMADVKPRHLAAFGGADIDRGVRSSFFDHTDQKIEVLLLSLDEIHRLAEGRPITIFLAPRFTDFPRYAAVKANPFADRLRAWADARGVVVVDLLSEMYEHHGGDMARIRELFLPCDPHWSEAGNRLAADLLLRRAAR